MLSANSASYHAKLIKTVRLSDWSNPAAVSLTMRQAVPIMGGGVEHLSEQASSSNFRHFLNRLNRRLFGNAANRGKKVFAFAVIERSPDGRLHYHALVDRPERTDTDSFDALVGRCWMQTRWGHKQVDIQHSADEGWVHYMLKSRTKSSLLDAIDWDNAHLPCAD